MLPDWLVRPGLDSGALRAILPAWSGPVSALCALYRVELRGVARVRVFVEHLRANLG